MANLPTGTSPYTIQATIKMATNAIMGIVGWGSYGTANAVNAFRTDSSGSKLANYWWDADLESPSVPSLNLADGNWHDVEASFDGITRKITVSSTVIASDTPTGGAADSNTNFCVGKTGTGQYHASDLRIEPAVVPIATAFSLADAPRALVLYPRSDGVLHRQHEASLHL